MKIRMEEIKKDIVFVGLFSKILSYLKKENLKVEDMGSHHKGIENIA